MRKIQTLELSRVRVRDRLELEVPPGDVCAWVYLLAAAPTIG